MYNTQFLQQGTVINTGNDRPEPSAPARDNSIIFFFFFCIQEEYGHCWLLLQVNKNKCIYS